MDETTTAPDGNSPHATPPGVGEDRAAPSPFDLPRPAGVVTPVFEDRPTLVPGGAPPPAGGDALPTIGAALGTAPATASPFDIPTTAAPLVVPPVVTPAPVAALSPQPTATPVIAASSEFDPATFVSQLAERLSNEIHKAIQGQEEIVETALVALLTGGHALFEGVPGTAKTLLVRALAASCSSEFKRIQFTPDLMPSDISGTNVFDMATSQFHLRRGPIFSEIVLADEINRTPPKTQAALLEAMEEKRVSIDGTPNPLPPIFTVFATQNPVEYEGTYPLPEAQLDRFLVKVVVPYPSEDAEMRMLSAWDRGFKSGDLTTANIQAVASVEDILKARSALPRVTVEPKIIGYITTIVRRTRESRQLTLGASPRASVALLQASKTLALMRGRNFVIPDDVKGMTLPVLRHRVLLKPEAEIEGIGSDRVLTSLVEGVEVPR